MAKKSSTARSVAQRNKARAQKSFALVQAEGTTETPEVEAQEEQIAVPEPVSAAVSTASNATAQSVQHRQEPVASVAEQPAASSNASRGSAAARIAARRQAQQQKQQRNTATLITAEHYSYVRRDLIFIAILATIMVAAVIILYFVIGTGTGA